MSDRELNSAAPILRAVLDLPREERMDALATAVHALIILGALDKCAVVRGL